MMIQNMAHTRKHLDKIEIKEMGCLTSSGAHTPGCPNEAIKSPPAKSMILMSRRSPV